MKSDSYKIRFAYPDELPQLQEIENAAVILFRETKYSDLIDSDPLSIEFLQVQQKDNKIWVAANSEDDPVGFAVVKIIDDSPHLHEIDIQPEHARQGLGTELIQTVVEWATQAGHEKMTLSTFRDIVWNAPFYRKLGFQELNDSDLSEGLIAIRKKEAESSLPIEDRICMSLKL